MAGKLLHDLYYTPGLPTTYGSVDRLLKAAKRVNKTIKKRDVEEWLLSQDTYTLHRKARRKLSAEPRVYVGSIDEQWAMDLCDVSNISEHNDGNNFILTAIDVFSKWADAEPVRRKSGPAVASAFQTILNRTDRRPDKVETDHGKEFYNKHFAQLCKRNVIHHFSSQSSHKASVVERFNRSLKELMYKHFSAENTYKWLDVLPQLLKTYNNRFHRSIGCSPLSVNKDNESEVYRKLYKRKKTDRWGKLYKVGDMVRISRKRHVFEKGYLPQFTEEIFKIVNVIRNHRPYRYELEDLMGEAIAGRFAPEELQKVIKDTDGLWKVEKIIRKVKKRDGEYYYVKFRGFPSKFNLLIRAEDLEDLQPRVINDNNEEDFEGFDESDVQEAEARLHS